jgi:C4-dicarboxylate transporter DctQ subunit
MHSNSPPASPETSGNKIYETLRQKAQADLDAESHDVVESNPIESLVVGGLATLALLFCSYNVVMRLVAPALTLDFVEEVQVYMVIWAVFLSLGTLTMMDRHVKSDFFVNMFSPKMQAAVALLADVLGLIFSVGLVYFGGVVSYQAWDFGDVSTTVLRVPLWIYFAALPVGALLMAIAYLVRLKRKLFNVGVNHA